MFVSSTTSDSVNNQTDKTTFASKATKKCFYTLGPTRSYSFRVQLFTGDQCRPRFIF